MCRDCVLNKDTRSIRLRGSFAGRPLIEGTTPRWLFLPAGRLAWTLHSARHARVPHIDHLFGCGLGADVLTRGLGTRPAGRRPLAGRVAFERHPLPAGSHCPRAIIPLWAPNG